MTPTERLQKIAPFVGFALCAAIVAFLAGMTIAGGLHRARENEMRAKLQLDRALNPPPLGTSVSTTPVPTSKPATASVPTVKPATSAPDSTVKITFGEEEAKATADERKRIATATAATRAEVGPERISEEERRRTEIKSRMSDIVIKTTREFRDYEPKATSVEFTLLVNDKKYLGPYQKNSMSGNYTFYAVVLPVGVSKVEGRVEFKSSTGEVLSTRSVSTSVDTSKNVPKTFQMEIHKTNPIHTVTIQ